MNYLPERDIFKLLLKKQHFNQLIESIDLEHIKNNYPQLAQLYRILPRFHEKFPEQELNVEAFQAFFFTQYPDADKELYLELFKTLSELQIGDEVAIGIASSIKQRKTALKLSEMAYKYGTGIVEKDKLDEAVAAFAKEHDDVAEEQQEEFVTSNLEELLKSTFLESGLRFRLNCLNKSLGSLRKGDFGFIFARPETGKTTFLASEISAMLIQLRDMKSTQPILWFNNEEQGRKVFIRIYQAYFGVELDKLLANWKTYHDRFNSEVGHLFLLKDEAQLTKLNVERIVKKINPSLIVFDQIDKISGFQADRDDLLLGSIYQWARELAKTYCPVIGVCQADGTGDGVRWLTMHNVANAKTSKQAEADWILGIGVSYEEGTDKVRYLNISKNKLTGDSDTKDTLRHGRFEVLIRPTIARYEDIVKYD